MGLLHVFGAISGSYPSNLMACQPKYAYQTHHNA